MSYKQEKITPYGSGEEKAKQVVRMFDNIAHSYDLLNHRLSFGIDWTWRRKAVKKLSEYNPETILDIATGTGEFAVLAAKQLNPESITGTDISDGMMNIGREKIKKSGLEHVIRFENEDCEHLSYPDNTFDAVISAFGIRNFQNLDKGLSEMYRVLKNNGHVCILELSTPVTFPMKSLFRFYSHTLLPIYGRMISKDKEAYNYLTTTIEAFPQGETMVGIFKKAGFTDVKFKRFTFGICTCYIATK